MQLHRLRDLREDHDWTQQQLARQLFIDQRTYSSYERGAREIPLSVLIQLADIYGVSMDYLLERSDSDKRIVKR
ncbi:MAG: helix-turn-helix transcriptional regulator [Clostridiales bacterium]|mgnify:CR=1 FL=1|nr:helix-turn-helix transcriptional regulator [Clostridiales bacterium]